MFFLNHIETLKPHQVSKEFQRIHLPRIPQHRETSKCTLVYIEMYPGKVVALLKEQATVQTKINCRNESMLT